MGESIFTADRLAETAKLLDKVDSSEKDSLLELPVIPVRDIVIFPGMVVPLLVSREKSINGLEHAMTKQSHKVFLVTQKNPNIDDPTYKDLNRVGVVVAILQLVRLPDGSMKVLIEAHKRAKVHKFYANAKFGRTKVYILEEVLSCKCSEAELDAMAQICRTQFNTYVKLNGKLPDEIVSRMSSDFGIAELSDYIAGHLSGSLSDKQKLLRTCVVEDRLRLLIKFLVREIERIQLSQKILQSTKDRIETLQRERFLQEQLRVIQDELGDSASMSAHMEKLFKKLQTIKLPDAVRNVCEKEFDRLMKMYPMSPEVSVLENYIDWIVSLPWEEKTKDNLELDHAKEILERDHYGLEKAKDRILESLAVCKRKGSLKGQVVCFVGPPGVGKTSLARSIARALGRKFVRISLGGLRDEAEIKGHRRTYIGALPGRVIQCMKKAGTMNPVFLLDEIDKMGIDYKGDPSFALLEVLDPVENSHFSDHYLEIDYDLSDVFFIATANLEEVIPPVLKDRLEIIHLSSYTHLEKFFIAKDFLLKKRLEDVGLKKQEIEITDAALDILISGYTREAGVRELERQLGNICRKIVKEKFKSVSEYKTLVDKKDVLKLLGPVKFTQPKIPQENLMGLALGLCWTPVGGDVMPVEVLVLDGKAHFHLTGKLGQVMKESAEAGFSFIKSNASRLGIKPDFYKKKDLHIHVPEGAVPKDGPSAGVAMTVAMISALTKVKVRPDVAMTGEITLLGRVLPIGGVKEKVIAAARYGLIKVLLPSENRADLDEVPKDAREKLEFCFIDNLEQVWKEVFISPAF